MNSLIECSLKNKDISTQTIDSEFKNQINDLIGILNDYKKLLVNHNNNLVLKHGVDSLLESLYYLVDPVICTKDENSWKNANDKIDEIEKYMESQEFETFMQEVTKHVNELHQAKSKLKIKFK